MKKPEDHLLSRVPSIGEKTFRRLVAEGYSTVSDVMYADKEDLEEIPYLDQGKILSVFEYWMDLNSEYYLQSDESSAMRLRVEE